MTGAVRSRAATASLRSRGPRTSRTGPSADTTCPKTLRARSDGFESPGSRILLLRCATVIPACQPGARPPTGGCTDATSSPARVITQLIMEFEFHISPAPSSSRPQTGVGTEAMKSSTRWASAGSSLRSRGLSTASATSGMTPLRQRRTSYRNIRRRPTRRLPTGPPATTPRSAGSPRGTGACSMTKRPCGVRTSSAAW